VMKWHVQQHTLEDHSKHSN